MAASGGVEHDSGWYLGVARNLATRGIYASYTNTIRDDTLGWHPSIHSRFSVQDEDGFSYFPAGVTAGPGYVVPEALLLKLFGDGFWQYRAWPLLAFIGLLALSFVTVWRMSGIFALLLFQLWLWAVPQFTTQFAYEAFSEHIATLFLLACFVLVACTGPCSGLLRTGLAGLLLGLAVETKQLAALGVAGLVPVVVWWSYQHRRDRRRETVRWVVFAAAALAPIAGFELYRYLSLTSRFGLEAWQAINEDIRLHARSAGSGFDFTPILQPNWVFIRDKLNLGTDLGLRFPVLLWFGVLLAALSWLRYRRLPTWLLLSALWFATVGSFTWFIALSPTGWARHAWPALFFEMMLISVGLGLVVQNARRGLMRTVLYLAVIGLVVGLGRPESLSMKPALDQATIDSWRELRHLRGQGRGFPSTPLLPLADQVDLVAFFEQHVSSKDRVYYLEGWLNAEASTLVDKVFFSVERYRFLGQRSESGGQSYLILGPYQRGVWALTSLDYVSNRLDKYCADMVFSNPSYLLCRLRTELP